MRASTLLRICLAARVDLRASGIGVTMMSRTGWRGVVVATDPSCELLEELQFVCGEGPCIDAFRFGHPVLVEDLEDRLWSDWTGYAPLAQAAGVRAVFAFPLQVGAARLGALDVYRDTAGSLTPDELADSLIFADLALDALLDSQPASQASHPRTGLEEALDYRIYQAQGMVSVQLQVNVVEAMVRLRAYALGNDLRLSDVADRVLSGRLHLNDDGS